MNRNLRKALIYENGYFQAFFENDNSHLRNSYVKFVMCMLQGDYNIKDLVISLPQDVQALVLLHNPNANHNLTSEIQLMNTIN